MPSLAACFGWPVQTHLDVAEGLLLLLSGVLQIGADNSPSKMPKLTETFARKAPYSAIGTAKHWDTELKGLVLFAGKRTMSWYFRKNVGGQPEAVEVDRAPLAIPDGNPAEQPG